MTFQYTPDEDIRVHEEGAIRLICRAFQTHENGLPEWIKNSSDEYARTDTPPEDRVIVVLFTSTGSGASPTISVLDFNGMTSTAIETDFRVWADPEAARRGAGVAAVQGGHGNGGKCYMTMMFDEHALIHTVKNGRGNRYGVRGGSFRFGYIPDRERGRDYEASDATEELSVALASVGVDYAALPRAARAAFERSQAFTLVTGSKPKALGGRLPVVHLIDSLRDHSQMTTTLDFCDVYVTSNGHTVAGANPMVLEGVTPDPAFAEDRVIDIPEELVDPASQVMVSTTGGGTHPRGTLTLRTSDVSMRYSRKARHTVVYRSSTGFVGYKPVLEFDVQSPYRDRIYAECSLEALEGVKQNLRGALADSPLTRAVECFISTKIQEYAHDFEALHRRQYDQQEQDELSRMNEALDRWKNQFMSKYLQGLWGPQGTVNPPPPPPPLPTGTPRRIEVSLSHPRSGVGVSFRPTIKFFASDDSRIRPTPYTWRSDDTNVAWVDNELNVVTTFTAGSTEIWAETLDGRVASNPVPLEVVRVRQVELSPLDLNVPVGSHRTVDAKCHLSNGEVDSDIYLIWFESDPTVAQVSAAGQVFGHNLGATEVMAGDDAVMADQAVQVRVVEAKDGGDGDKRGRGFPKILVSGVDADPETGEAVQFAPDDPPVAQRPQDVDRNIWWINSSAPFARMYLDQGRGYGYRSREWRIYHLERFIDIMVQIALSSDPDNESMDVGAWLLKWGERAAEIQEAAAAALGDFIATGDITRVA
jgi:hypothetical protein